MNKEIIELTECEPCKPYFATQAKAAFFTNSTHIIGFCFDGTTSFRPGSRSGPNAIREASEGMESYSPYINKDTEDFNIIDCGNLPVHPSKWKLTNDYFHQVTKDLKLQKDRIKILTLGGEHSISYGPIRLHLDQYEDLVILHLDAHTDLRDGYLGEKFSHASIIKRIWDHMSDKNKLIQYGIRSGLKEEFDFMEKHKTRAHSLKECLSAIEDINDRPIYLTLDLDFFDPSVCPGTGTPEAGGESFGSFMSILKVLASKNFVGADIVELAPNIDSSGNSSVFAAKITREVLLAMNS